MDEYSKGEIAFLSALHKALEDGDLADNFLIDTSATSTLLFTLPSPGASQEHSFSVTAVTQMGTGVEVPDMMLIEVLIDIPHEVQDHAFFDAAMIASFVTNQGHIAALVFDPTTRSFRLKSSYLDFLSDKSLLACITTIGALAQCNDEWSSLLADIAAGNTTFFGRMKEEG